MDAHTIRLPSSSITFNWEYDVFLSFRGEDTRKNFTDHLYTSLTGQGIKTFRDKEELDNGKPISPKLLMAIEKSRIAIVVLSRNYASSTWCLEELVKILQCHREMDQTVFPIFYNIDPSDVRKQERSFADAFANHEERFRGDEKITQWRDALTQVASFKGWNSADWHESELIKDIAKAVWTIILPTLKTSQEDIIGIETKLKQLGTLLDIGSADVHIIGIWGMGGVGKTTIARAIYRRIHHTFEVSSFLTNIREESQSCGLASLQNKLLSRMLPVKDVISDVHEGMTMIQKVLCDKKLLLVLDDVDNLDHLDAFVPNQNLFGLGSRVIITTRNEDLLISFGVKRIFKVNELKDFEALQLLRLKAFGKKVPEEGFHDLSWHLVKLVGGLPLALQVLGSSLRNRKLNAWTDAIDELKEDVKGKIFRVLKISYDALGEKEKEMFLDIACFFNGKNKEWVMEILDACGFKAKRIYLLIQKSLINISDNKLSMHDLIQDMGRQIVRQNRCHKNSRLWFHGEVLKALEQEMDTQVIQSMFCKPLEVKVANCSPKVFSKMHSLRLLNVRNVNFPHGLEGLPNEIRYLKWSGYPLEFLPTNFEGNELIDIHMCHSNLKQFWKGKKHLEKLKYIKLNHSLNLQKTPKFSEIPNIEKLNLEGCTNLLEIHPSISVAKRLIVLNLKNCKNLTSLPSHIQIESLEVFLLSGCSKVKKIPEFKGKMERLLELYLDGTSISELPKSIGSLSGLTCLNLRNCKNLILLPSAISNLKSLQHLNLSGCSKLGNLGNNFTENEYSQERVVTGTVIKQVFVLVKKEWKSFFFTSQQKPVDVGLPFVSGTGFYSLTKLDLSDCNLEAVSDRVGSLSSLKKLNLSGNNFLHLPASLSHRLKLQYLRVERCKKLMSLPNLPPNIIFVKAENCISLTTLPDKSELNPLVGTRFDCVNCFQLNDISMVLAMLKSSIRGNPPARSGFDIVIPGSEVPDWFTKKDYSQWGSISELFPYNDDCIGCAICVVFEAGEPMNDHLDEANLNSQYLPILRCKIFERLLVNETHSTPFFYFKVDYAKFKSSHIWLSYLPRHNQHLDFKFLKRSEWVEFKFQRSQFTGLKVKQCGFRLMKRQDVEELKPSTS